MSLRFCACVMLASISCKAESGAVMSPKLVLTLNNDDPRYRGAATLSGIEPPPEIAKDLRMSVYPAVLTPDSRAVTYLHVNANGPLELRFFRPGAPPKILLTFDDENDGSPRLAWSPDGSRLAVLELRLKPNEDWRHPRSRLTVLDVSTSGTVIRRFTTPITAYHVDIEDLAAPTWKDNQIVAYESMQDGARAMAEVVTDSMTLME